MSAATEVLDRLRAMDVLAGLSEEQLEWLGGACEIVDYAEGDIVLRPGDPPLKMYFILKGEFHAHPETGAADEGRVYYHHAGEVTGMLPFSRMKRIPRLIRAAAPTQAALYPAANFPELLERIPVLEPRLVAVLADRVRQTTRTEQQRDRLVSLGRLAAGLAHEMNNPAAAGQRAASELRRAMDDVTAASFRLAAAVDQEALDGLQALRDALDPAAAASLGTLERADREAEIISWLESRGVEDGDALAPGLVEGGVDAQWLDRLAQKVAPALFQVTLDWLEATLRTDELLGTVQQASQRISTLVGAVKEYTFMDQAPEQEVEVNAGLDATVRMLTHKLKGVTVVRRYAPHLPRVRAYGAELNQVWTNLIDNAADAVGPGGEIVLATSLQEGSVKVDICDNGPGMPAEVQAQVFDPFFTTKGVGKGTGLGLDIVQRIVQQHRGSVAVHSRPGKTRFSVTLPAAEG
jgi:signal transduction histidine kinase